MKRFKKITIYVLVGVLLSSAVIMSDKKAEVVQASATLTLGTGALLMLGILGAYGIVYKGAVDSATGEYIWEGDRKLYPDEVEDAEEWFSRMYDNAVRNWCAQNGKDPDDWNGDDDGDGDDMDEIIEQPPLWEKLVGSSVCQDREMMKRAIKLVGAFGVICADVVTEFKQKTDSNTEILQNFQNTSLIQENINDYPYVFTCVNSTGSQYSIKMFPIPVNFYKNSKNDWCIDRDSEYLYGYSNSSQLTKTHGYAGNSLMGSGWKFVSEWSNLPYYNSLNDVPIGFTEENTSISILNNENIGYSTNSQYDSENKPLPIITNFYFPSTNRVQSFLDSLENSTGDETGTQNVVDTFVDSLGQEETETEPDTGGNTGTGTNPDTGGQGGTGGDSEGNEDEENGMFLADLKKVFPFCIPFDLVDCFRLFNAEPETPRVEVPLHFGIVEKDYTFVIDLKDFDGVAEICRSMFLILYIVGLVIATRPLIRG